MYGMRAPRIPPRIPPDVRASVVVRWLFVGCPFFTAFHPERNAAHRQIPHFIHPFPQTTGSSIDAAGDLLNTARWMYLNLFL
jgi:hypothetical protein